jgi:hypothetical protein
LDDSGTAGADGSIASIIACFPLTMRDSHTKTSHNPPDL